MDGLGIERQAADREINRLRRALLGGGDDSVFSLGGGVQNYRLQVVVERKCSGCQHKTWAAAHAQIAIDGDFDIVLVLHSSPILVRCEGS